MHSHGRTLLSKLGFGDVDRKNSRHDLACNYLALREEVLVATLQSAVPKPLRIERAKAQLEVPITKGEGQYATTVGWLDAFVTFDISYPVKISAHQATLSDIRFENIIREGRRLWPDVPTNAFLSDYPEYHKWFNDQERRTPRPSAEEEERDDARILRILGQEETSEIRAIKTLTGIIEVKIQPVGSGDLIRQLRLYNQYVFSRLDHLEPRFDSNDESWKSGGSLRKLIASDPNAAYLNKKTYQAERGLEAFIRGQALRVLTIAVCDYELDAEYTRALRSAGIHPVRLGAGFEKFLKDQADAVPDDEVPQI